MLYPQLNPCRDVYSLNGLWRFAPVEDGYQPATPCAFASPMAVPASYNELVTDAALRDFVGPVLYETTFSVPVRQDHGYRLRIGATSHKCQVFLNGEWIGDGINGYYPIDLPLENLREENRLSVIIDNRLSFETLPVGRVEPNGKLTIQHDFYNFTGIHRDVMVYSLPSSPIRDIEIKTAVCGDYRKVAVRVDTDAEKVCLTVKTKEGTVAAVGEPGELIIPDPHLWSPEDPYLYSLIVETENDRYQQRFGIRKIGIKNGQFLLNDKPVYFKGFGMHEDFFLLGKGNNSAVNIRNFELLKWMGANSIRTSHYPYCEEIMDMADEYGILVIDEVPAVGMNWWRDNFTPDRINERTQALHKELIRQLIARDKNHPSVVMLSVANEAATHEPASRPYFKGVIDYAREITELPITIVEFTKFDDVSHVGDLVDVIGLNRYYGWYTDHGDISLVRQQMKEELEKYHAGFGKPILVTEFGADTIEGLHSIPCESFSEEFQMEYLRENCKAFDECSFCIGEHVWNFADFKTKQGLTRVRGNRKGVFTKDRQPKLAAHYLRERWSKR